MSGIASGISQFSRLLGSETQNIIIYLLCIVLLQRERWEGAQEDPYHGSDRQFARVVRHFAGSRVATKNIKNNPSAPIRISSVSIDLLHFVFRGYGYQPVDFRTFLLSYR